MHISYSMMTTAKQCWKKYEWKYQMNLEPIEQRTALVLGKIVHAGFEMYYRGFSHPEVLAYILNAFAEERAKVELSEVESVDVACAIATGMWTSYPKDLATFQEIYPEKKFSVSLNKNGKGLRIEGIIDGLVRKENRWWVREMKTTSLSHRQFKERMDTSEQATEYVWAAKRLGYDVAGVVYDAIHKPLLRKGVNETTEQFCARIVKDYATRPENYFQREYVYRTDIDINHFVEDLKAFKRDLMRKIKFGGFYRNTSSCIAFNSTCQYQKICFSEKPDVLTLQLFYKQREEVKADVGTQEAAE